jgi:hypothetical protein
VSAEVTAVAEATALVEVGETAEADQAAEHAEVAEPDDRLVETAELDAAAPGLELLGPRAIGFVAGAFGMQVRSESSSPTLPQGTPGHRNDVVDSFL